MEKYASEVVNQAKEWLGKREDDGSHRTIIDIYNAHIPLARGYMVKYTDPWCATFVSAVAIKLGYTSIIPTECGCEPMINLFKKLGAWVEDDAYTPRAGDIIFFDWDDSGKEGAVGNSDHVGIVEYISGSTINVIEGNKNNAVERRFVEINDKNIRGYGVPNYDINFKNKVRNDYSNHWAKSAIQFMVDKKIMVGDGKGTFRPDDKITRAEVAQTIANLLNLLGIN